MMSSRPSHRRPSLSVNHDSNATYINGHGSSATSSKASGYATPVFTGKEEQRAKVQVDIALKVLHLQLFRCSLRIASLS